MNRDGQPLRVQAGAATAPDEREGNQGNSAQALRITQEGLRCLQELEGRAWWDLTVRQAVILTGLRLAARGEQYKPDHVVAALRQRHLPVCRAKIPQLWWDELDRLVTGTSYAAGIKDDPGWAGA